MNHSGHCLQCYSHLITLPFPSLLPHPHYLPLCLPPFPICLPLSFSSSISSSTPSHPFACPFPSSPHLPYYPPFLSHLPYIPHFCPLAPITISSLFLPPLPHHSTLPFSAPTTPSTPFRHTLLCPISPITLTQLPSPLFICPPPSFPSQPPHPNSHPFSSFPFCALSLLFFLPPRLAKCPILILPSRTLFVHLIGGGGLAAVMFLQKAIWKKLADTFFKKNSNTLTFGINHHICKKFFLNQKIISYKPVQRDY